MFRSRRDDVPSRSGVGDDRAARPLLSASRCWPSAGPNACHEAAWVGTGTTADGSIVLATGARVSAATANVVFNRLGGADAPGTFTLTNPSTGRTATVAMSSTGRVTVTAP
jgi:hypothetical protein